MIYNNKYLYFFIHRNNLIIYIQLILILILYYILQAFKYSKYPIILIDEFLIYILNFTNIFMLLILLIINYNLYLSKLKNIYKICNLSTNIYLYLIINYNNEENELIDEIDDNNINHNNIHNNNELIIPIDNNYTNQKQIIKYQDLNNIKEIILFYVTYIFIICNISNNNFINDSTFKIKNYAKFDTFINEEINNLYYNFNINHNKFKLDYINYDLIKYINIIYKNNYLCYNHYNTLINYINQLNKTINTILFQLDCKIYILLTFISNILLWLSIISINLYYINFLPDDGIIFVLILSFIYLFIQNINYMLLNSFKYTNNIDNKNYGINLINILHNLYDEFYIISSINIGEIKFQY